MVRELQQLRVRACVCVCMRACACYFTFRQVSVSDPDCGRWGDERRGGDGSYSLFPSFCRHRRGPGLAAVSTFQSPVQAHTKILSPERCTCLFALPVPPREISVFPPERARRCGTCHLGSRITAPRNERRKRRGSATTIVCVDAGRAASIVRGPSARNAGLSTTTPAAAAACITYLFARSGETLGRRRIKITTRGGAP